MMQKRYETEVTKLNHSPLLCISAHKVILGENDTNHFLPGNIYLLQLISVIHKKGVDLFWTIRALNTVRNQMRISIKKDDDLSLPVKAQQSM